MRQDGPPSPDGGVAGDTADATPAKNEWTAVTSSAIPSHRTSSPSKSALKSGEKYAANQKSIKFNEQNEIRYYEKESLASERITKTSSVLANGGGQPCTSSASISPKEALATAVQHKTCGDLIRELEAGAAADPEVADSGLQQHYMKVKEALADVKKGLDKNGSDSLLKEKRRDLSSKRTVLNVYINSSHLIEKSMFWKHWTGFDLRIRYIELHKASSMYVSGRSKQLCGKLKARVAGVSEDLVSHEFVSYARSARSPKG
jgi:hypothetical protein